MTKTIETLVHDIHEVLEGRNPLADLPEGITRAFGERVADLVNNRLINRKEREPRLSMSNIGRPCVRQTWLEIHRPEFKVPLRAETYNKFLFGDLIEEFLLLLAELAGHEVVGRQDYMEVEGVPGSRDVVIDGVLVDVKSASTYSFKKFQEGTLVDNDAFGYIGQIQTYLEASQDDPLVRDKDRCAFLVMDKTLGHICLDIHPRVDFDVREIARNKVQIINSDEMPERSFEPVPDGKSGNMKLPLNCSYCNMKHACYDNLRTFLYSYGPVYLTTVEKEPNVLEVTDTEKEFLNK